MSRRIVQQLPPPLSNDRYFAVNVNLKPLFTPGAQGTMRNNSSCHLIGNWLILYNHMLFTVESFKLFAEDETDEVLEPAEEDFWQEEQKQNKVVKKIYCSLVSFCWSFPDSLLNIPQLFGRCIWIPTQKKVRLSHKY